MVFFYAYAIGNRRILQRERAELHSQMLKWKMARYKQGALVGHSNYSICKIMKFTYVSFLFVVGMCSFGNQAIAQDTDSTTWSKSLIGKAALTQVGFQNWSEGGVNTLAVSTGIDGTFSNTSGRWEQTHQIRLAYGLVKQDTLDFRKAEDLIQVNSDFKYLGNGFFQRFNPTFAATLRTQFFEGLNFDSDPLGRDRTPPVKVSDLFAPATLTQSIGLSYAPKPWFSQRVGIAAKETVVTIERLRPLYAVDIDKSARIEGGLEAVTQFDKEIATNVRYKASFSVFAALNQPDQPDIIFENLVAMKVNTWLSVNFELVAIWDKDIDAAVQLKEVFSVGLSYILL